MLNSVGLIGSMFIESIELGIIESTMRVLLACISCTDPDVSLLSHTFFLSFLILLHANST